MSPDWPSLQGGGQRFEAAGMNTADSAMVTVVGGASDTKGSWVEIIASTAYQAFGLWLFLGPASAAATFLVDIGVGASAESVIIPNFFMDSRYDSKLWSTNAYFPIGIPAGTRIAARAQGDWTSSRNLEVGVILVGTSFLPGSPCSVVEDYGADTATSAGLVIDPGGTANTKGSYVEMIASTTYPIRWLCGCIGQNGNSNMASVNWLTDIAVGAATESIVIPNFHHNCSSFKDLMLPRFFGPIPFDAPAGTRIAARAQCDITDATDRLFNLALYGIGG